MKEIERRIFVDDTIYNKEYSYYYGRNKNEIVCFVYYNIKNDKETEIRYFNYREALNLARKRGIDKRYKNFEFWITL